jgi:lysophospholipase L1-like esterase
MKIAFIGDSITAAMPGVSYVDKVDAALADVETLNYGKGGDTVISVLTRLETMRIASDIDILFVFIGVNDVFVKTGWWHPTLKRVMKQPWVKNNSEFQAAYQRLVAYCQPLAKRVVLLPPLLVGEDVTSKANQTLQRYATTVAQVAKDHRLDYIDTRSMIVEALREQPIASYRPKRLGQIKQDMEKLTSDTLIDQASQQRGLHVTMDGVHLNSTGAGLIAQAIIEYVKEPL